MGMTKTETLTAAAAILTTAGITFTSRPVIGRANPIIVATSTNEGLDVVFALAPADLGVRVAPWGGSGEWADKYTVTAI